MSFGKFQQRNPGAPTLKQVVGEGEVADITIMAHVHAPRGINPWAGTDDAGIPLEGDGPVVYTRGYSADVKAGGGKRPA